MLWRPCARTGIHTSHTLFCRQRRCHLFIFTASIHRIHPPHLPSLPSSLLPLCSISPTLIALSVPLPSQSSPFIPSTSYRSDSIFISALVPLRSPVPRQLRWRRRGSLHRSEAAPPAETQPPIYLEINHLLTFRLRFDYICFVLLPV